MLIKTCYIGINGIWVQTADENAGLPDCSTLLRPDTSIAKPGWNMGCTWLLRAPVLHTDSPKTSVRKQDPGFTLAAGKELLGYSSTALHRRQNVERNFGKALLKVFQKQVGKGSSLSYTKHSVQCKEFPLNAIIRKSNDNRHSEL